MTDMSIISTITDKQQYADCKSFTAKTEVQNDPSVAIMNPSDEFGIPPMEGEQPPIQVGPSTLGGPVSAIMEGYYDPKTEEFTQPMPHYNKESYNCHSLAWHDSWGDTSDDRNFPQWKRWDNYPNDDFAEKGYVERQPGERINVGDRAVYWTDANNNKVMDVDEINHSAIVVGVDQDGNAKLIAGKWGEEGTFVHGPHQVPEIYGTNIAFFRNTNPDRKPVITKRQLDNMLNHGKRSKVDNSHPERYVSSVAHLERLQKEGKIKTQA